MVREKAGVDDLGDEWWVERVATSEPVEGLLERRSPCSSRYRLVRRGNQSSAYSGC